MTCASWDSHALNRGVLYYPTLQAGYPFAGSRVFTTTFWLLHISAEISAATRSTSVARPKKEAKIVPVAGLVSVAVLQAACKRRFALCQSSSNWLTWRTNLLGSIFFDRNIVFGRPCTRVVLISIHPQFSGCHRNFQNTP